MASFRSFGLWDGASKVWFVAVYYVDAQSKLSAGSLDGK